MIEPLPQSFSIYAIARFSAFFLSSPITNTAISSTLWLTFNSRGTSASAWALEAQI